MPSITGGNVIHGGTVIGGSKTSIAWVDAVPTDANVGGGYYTPANGDIAINRVTGNIYERQTGVWTRIDTL